MRRHIKAPSPSVAVALLALFVALGGTGYAAVKINGKSIKSGTITGSKFKNKTLTAGKFKNKTLTGGKLKNDTLTGRQIRESTLGTVPRAAVAATAGTATALTDSAKAGFLSATDVDSTGLIKLPMAASLAAAPRTIILTHGPFSANARCYDDGTGKRIYRRLLGRRRIPDGPGPSDAVREAVLRVAADHPNWGYRQVYDELRLTRHDITVVAVEIVMAELQRTRQSYRRPRR